LWIFQMNIALCNIFCIWKFKLCKRLIKPTVLVFLALLRGSDDVIQEKDFYLRKLTIVSIDFFHFFIGWCWMKSDTCVFLLLDNYNYYWLKDRKKKIAGICEMLSLITNLLIRGFLWKVDKIPLLLERIFSFLILHHQSILLSFLI